MTDEHDDELTARLRAADPASSLPPADPGRVARLLEDVMSTELTTENRATGTRGRGPLTWLVAAAAVLLIAGVGVFGLLNHDADPPAPPTAADYKTVTELSAPSPVAYGARCMVPNAQLLRQQSVAFEGIVTQLADDVVTLEPTRWYTGDETDLVRVQAPPAAIQDLVGAVRFEEGGRYLVSASDGQVTVCGFSAPYSERLAALYREAFAG